MKKWLLIAGCALLLSGCTKSNIVARGGELSPYFGTVENVELVWDQGLEELADYAQEYEEIVNLAYMMEEAQGGEAPTVYLTVFAASGMEPEAAAKLGTELVKVLGNCMSDQDITLTKSSAESYGSAFDGVNICVRVVPEENMEDRSMALVDDLIPAGSDYRPVAPNR